MPSALLKSEKTRAILAKNVRAMLATLQLSENELARRSGVSQKQVNNLTQVRTGCGIDALEAIARAMALETWQLLVPGFHLRTEIAGRTARLMNAYLHHAREGRESFDAIIKSIEHNPK
jgi:hypothetical protein